MMVSNAAMVTPRDSFPPCTAETCSVDEDEKQRYAAANSNTGNGCEMAEKCIQACAAYGKVCPCAARIAAHSACETIEKLKKDSVLFAEKPPFTHLKNEDIVMGQRIGEGGFSYVNQCVVISGAEAGQEFAIKYLKRKAMVDLHQFKHGAADLAVESYFLQVLDSPHIVKLHGITAGSVETNVSSGKECCFFIVIDKLDETLERRIYKWKEEDKRYVENSGLFTRWTTEHKEHRTQEVMERVRIGYMIAQAMEYLHEKNIIYRDLKPDNIGFDKNGVLKLFDFGLARELKPDYKLENGKYKMTGNTGSRRYMAPEVAQEEPYDQSVDVFSFGILLWEMLATEKPFFGYSSGKHMQNVVIRGERPSMGQNHTAYWPLNLQWLIQRCWSDDPILRPPFSMIKQVLRDVLNKIEDVPDGLSTTSFRSSELSTVADAPPSRIKPMPKNARSVSAGEKKKVKPPSQGFSAMKPASGSHRRNKTWGLFIR